MSSHDNNQHVHVDRELDLRGEICPYTFIKSRLILEQMADGEILGILVDYYPAIKNITRSMKDLGYTVLGTRNLSELETMIYIQKTTVST